MDNDFLNAMDTVSNDNKNMTSFLKELQRHGLLESRDSMIVYADDQYINRQMLKMTFQDIGLAEKLKTFSNGEEVLNFFESTLEELSKDSGSSRQPVSLLLLDINMPIISGLETLLLLKEKFRKYNSD